MTTTSLLPDDDRGVPTGDPLTELAQRKPVGTLATVHLSPEERDALVAVARAALGHRCFDTTAACPICDALARLKEGV